MNKFIKTTVSISLIFILAGLTLTVYGVTQGATISTLKNISFDLLPWINAYDDFDTKYNYDEMTAIEGISDTISLDSSSNIELDLKYGEYEIKTWDNKNVAVEYSEKIANMYYTIKENTLTIVASNKINGIAIDEDYGKVTIWIPREKTFSNANIKIGAGELTIEEINATNLKLSVGAGEATVNHIVTENGTFDVGAGELDISSGFIRTGNAKVGLGEMKYTGSIRGNFYVDCGMGEVTLGVDEGIIEFNYELSVGLGEIQIGKETFSGLNQKTITEYSSDYTIDINCGMGEVKIFSN